MNYLIQSQYAANALETYIDNAWKLFGAMLVTVSPFPSVPCDLEN